MDHVRQYRRPKDEDGNEIIEKGCGPKTPTPSPSPSPEPEPSPPTPKKKKSKKKKLKYKKEKKLKRRKLSKSPEKVYEEKISGTEKEKREYTVHDGDRSDHTRHRSRSPHYSKKYSSAREHEKQRSRSPSHREHTKSRSRHQEETLHKGRDGINESDRRESSGTK